MKRRTYIASVGVSAVSLLAGCSNSGGSNETTTDPTTSPPPTTDATTDSPTTTQTTEPVKHEYAPDPWENIKENSTDTSSTVSGEATLEEGQYALRQAQFNRPYDIEISVTVREGGSIDILGMSADEFDRYRDRQTPVYYDGFYETGVSDTTISGQVQSGDHRFVFDNSSVFGSDSSGTVTFDFETVVSV